MSSKAHCGMALALAFLSSIASEAQDRSLTILNAIVQQSEDGAKIASNYEFLPGDYVYFTFQLSGFSVKENEEANTRLIALSYALVMQDGSGIALAESTSGDIKTQVNPEDKNWLPKRRASFLIPSFVPAGEYHVRVTARDELSNKSASVDVPFRIGGESIEHSDGITVQNFRFLREESSRESLAIAAYRPGDTIFTTFDIAGFLLHPGNEYDVSYGVAVTGPDGKPFLNEPNAAQMAAGSFYPARYLPGDVRVMTQASAKRGTYILVVNVQDKLAARSYSFKQSFTLE